MAGAMRVIRRAVRAAGARVGWHAVPDFLIIGAQKAGTTALDTYLRRHPRLFGAQDKELYFFSPEMMRDWNGRHPFPFFRRLEKSFSGHLANKWALRWYHSRFPVRRPGKRLYFEATPDYLYSHKAPSRIAAYRQDMKIIVILRNPVERAYSAWNMCRTLDDPEFAPWKETRSFEEAVREELTRIERGSDEPGTDYVRRGFYEGLKRYKQLFPAEQILVIENREMRRNQPAMLGRICKFLDIPPFATAQPFEPLYTGTYDSPMKRSIRSELAQLYAPSNRELFKLIGRTFDWDSGRSADLAPSAASESAEPRRRSSAP